MPTCKECHWVRRMVSGDPRKGICTVRREEVGEGQVAPKAAAGKVMLYSTEACEHFEPQKGHEEYARDGY